MIVKKGSQTKSQQLKEIEYQNKMLLNLKKWMRNLILLSSVGVAVAFWAINLMDGMIFNIVGGASVFIAAVSVIICAVVGLAVKRGQENIDKITKMVFTTSE